MAPSALARAHVLQPTFAVVMTASSAELAEQLATGITGTRRSAVAQYHWKHLSDIQLAV